MLMYLILHQVCNIRCVQRQVILVFGNRFGCDFKQESCLVESISALILAGA